MLSFNGIDGQDPERGRVAPRRLVASIVAGLLAASTAGCATAGGDDAEHVGEVTAALENDNALNPNALNPNALNPNALNPNALNPNALNPNALSSAAMSALRAPDAGGDLSRELMRYVVSCALDSTQSFSFTWTDAGSVSHPTTYPGLLGVARSWISAPLSTADQQWVSACLASRVNWYGIPVTLSSRGENDALGLGLGEAVAFPTEEGAFWGNLFTSSPAVFACNNPLAASHARYLLRDCADGHLDTQGVPQECGMIHIVGSCATYCQGLDAIGLYHPRCVSNLEGNGFLAPYLANSTATTEAITVFLN
jgi:hypothetical protein